MKQFILLIIFTGILNACGGGSSPPNNQQETEQPPSTPTVVSLHGYVIDGYMKQASICVDINLNQSCDTNDPITHSAADGSFSFSKIQTTEAFILLIASGGIDTTSNQAYQGKLHYITSIDTDFSHPIYMTPLKDLVATQFLASKPPAFLLPSSYLNGINETLFRAFKAQDKQSPMLDKNYFLANQNIEVTKRILLGGVRNELGITEHSSAYTVLQSDISHAIAKQRYESPSQSMDTEHILGNLESRQSISLSPALRQFLSEQISSNQAVFERMHNISIDTQRLEEIQRSIDLDMKPVYEILAAPGKLTNYTIHGMNHFSQMIDEAFMADLHIPSSRSFDTPPQMPF